MTEQEALNKIPNDWIKDINPTVLEEKANAIWSTVIYQFAEQMGITPSYDLDKMITKLAKAHKISKDSEIKALKDTCLQDAKIDVFIEKYGHLFKKDNNGDLSYSKPMLKKITGLAL